jgi:apolipoprotein D and lipocalin family protein
MFKKIFFLFVIFLSGCAGIPEDLKPVVEFDITRYLGTWYEIARLDHSFERGLEKVSANYSLRNDGGIRVINKGYDPKKGTWKDAEGKAYFLDTPAVGRLKVSFFGPFYGGYNIIELDKQHYQYALVCGPDKSYLWILSRTPDMDKDLLKLLISKAKMLGFKTESLIFVNQ